MVVLKVKRDTYGSNTEYLEHALRYVGNPKKCQYLAGFGVDPYDLDHCYNQMMTVKEYFHKSGDNPLFHFIISFDSNVKTLHKAIVNSYYIARCFKEQYQVLWCVHYKKRGDSRYHVHMIVNSVNLIDGKLLNITYRFMKDLCNYIKEQTGDDCRYYFGFQNSTDDVD